MITGKILGKTYVINGVSADASGFVPDMSTDTYYEVLRLIDGKVLFLQDHLERLRRSLSGSSIDYPGDRKVIETLELLVKENLFREGNIRICLRQSGGKSPLLQGYFVPYIYPDIKMYKEGVMLATYPHQRLNPGIKKWDDLFRNSVAAFIRERGIYEAALVNSKHQITEGSRSNLFFIDRKGQLITVPEKEVLPGITRKYVLEIAKREGVPLLEKAVDMEELTSLVSVFISGTSPKVLPVKQIDELFFDVTHPILHLLMDQFELLVQKNLSSI
jgi:branched-chain amino acid aminotransferase